MTRVLWFLIGMLVATVLLRTVEHVEAQQSVLAVGFNSGTARPIAVDASGNVLIVGN